jgi:O-succinylbenzoic acid--CoA ligase
MTPNFSKIHLRFKLNGLFFDREELKEVAYSFIKEGEPYEQAIGSFLTDWLNEKEEVEVRTSGTTGNPKLITIKKQQMVNSALATGNFFKTEVGDTALHCLSANYIAGKMMLVRAMILGLELDLVAPTSNPLELVDKEYDFCAMVPFQVSHSIKRLNQIKKLIIGGAPVSNELFQKIQLLPTDVFTTYGMTETVTHIAAKKLNNFSSAKAVRNNYYEVLPNVTITTDKRQCLIITATQVSDEPVITNDIVKIISPTQFEWIGRYDNVINSGGIKLYPEQIELKLAEDLPASFFISSIQDAQLGEKLVLIIEGEEEEIPASTFSSLDTYEIPKAIYFVNEFARTPSRKLQREETISKIKL